MGDIEDVIDLELRIYVILLSSLLGHLLVVIVLYLLLGFWIYHSEGSDKHGEALFSLVDSNMRKWFTFAILDLLLRTLLVLGEVQTCDTVKGAEYWQLVALFLAVHHEH